MKKKLFVQVNVQNVAANVKTISNPIVLVQIGKTV